MEINQNVKSDRKDKDVENALAVVTSFNQQRTKQDKENELIQQMFNSTFTISKPDGSHRIDSQLLYQAIWRTANRMKPLDFRIHGTQRPPAIEKIVTDGIATVMDRGGYDSALRDKNGVFFNLLMYGDGFLQIGANPERNTYNPVLYRSLSNSNIYVDSFATDIRSSARKVVVIHSYSWEEFISLFPKAKKTAGAGKIPRSLQKETKKSYSQGAEQKNEVEVAYSYDIDTATMVVFAGAECTVIEKYKKDKYPFKLNKENYIPISQFLCVPSADGFFNKGIGHLVYKLAMITNQLLNAETGHIFENVYPINIVSVPQGEATKFFGKMKMAQEMRANGKTAAVVLEYDPTAPTGVSNTAMTTPSLFNEWQAVFDRFINELRRNGINIDELDQTGQKTATEVVADEENANAFVKQIQEYNATETQHIVDATMQSITEFVSKGSNIPLNLTTEIRGERFDDVTLGMISEELKKHNYFTRVNSRSGVIPSNKLLMARSLQMLNMAQPGSEAQKRLIGTISDISDIDIPADQYFMQQQQAPAGKIDVPTQEEMPIQDTDRQVIQ